MKFRFNSVGLFFAGTLLITSWTSYAIPIGAKLTIPPVDSAGLSLGDSLTGNPSRDLSVPPDNSLGGAPGEFDFSCPNDGEMVCDGDYKFKTCDHGSYVTRDIAPGTKCKQVGKYLTMVKK